MLRSANDQAHLQAPAVLFDFGPAGASGRPQVLAHLNVIHGCLEKKNAVDGQAA